jgi:hypothetical protein
MARPCRQPCVAHDYSSPIVMSVNDFTVFLLQKESLLRVRAAGNSPTGSHAPDEIIGACTAGFSPLVGAGCKAPAHSHRILPLALSVLPHSARGR